MEGTKRVLYWRKSRLGEVNLGTEQTNRGKVLVSTSDFLKGHSSCFLECGGPLEVDGMFKLVFQAGALVTVSQT